MKKYKMNQKNKKKLKLHLSVPYWKMSEIIISTPLLFLSVAFQFLLTPEQLIFMLTERVINLWTGRISISYHRNDNLVKYFCNPRPSITGQGDSMACQYLN